MSSVGKRIWFLAGGLVIVGAIVVGVGFDRGPDRSTAEPALRRAERKHQWQRVIDAPVDVEPGTLVAGMTWFEAERALGEGVDLMFEDGRTDDLGRHEWWDTPGDPRYGVLYFRNNKLEMIDK